MATGIGVDPTKSGATITSGRSALDDRKIWGGLYTPGIINGGSVTTSASLLQYTVSEGVAAIKTATGQIVMAPIPATTVTAPAAPTSGSPRVDIVYVKQRFPADGDSNVVVGVAAGTALPTNALELMRFSLPLNASNTNSATRTGFQIFSIPYGANLGVIYEYKWTTSGVLPNLMGQYGHGTFYLPTDRRLRFSISALLYANGATGFSDSTYCEYFFIPLLDGADVAIWQSPGLHQSWATYNWSYDLNVSAGTHTTQFVMSQLRGPGSAATFYGSDEFGFSRKGIIYRIEDVGVQS
jgi:hypothetical protein